MGSGIAEVCARAGVQVTCCDSSDQALDSGRARVTASLDRAVERGKLLESSRDEAVERIQFTTDLNMLSNADFVFEAVVEDLQAKLEIFRQLDEIVVKEKAVLASNTSAIPIMQIAMATSRPERVMGVHFFNPVPVMSLVELVTCLMTSAGTAVRARDFIEHTLGKTAIESKDRAGFIVNALLIPYVLAAIRMFESGFASARDIDRGMTLGCAHPMGPLELADLIGLDTVSAIADAMYLEFRDATYSPPSTLLRMVEAGLLGKKTQRGFYDYDSHRVRT
jgi:3-hydroxybutyryl-CoA dehydrogenase